MQIKELEAIFDSLRQTAYRPIVEQNKFQPNFSTRSKYNGYPYLRNDKDWPHCGICGKLMPLIFQLNLSDIPVHRQEGYLVQYFQCVNMDSSASWRCEIGYPKVGSACLRKIKIMGRPVEIPVDFNLIFEVQSTFINNLLKKLPTEIEILGWESFDDYPCGADFNEKVDYLAPIIGEETLDYLWENIDLVDKLDHKQCSREDKLFGYPCWDQTDNYPRKADEIMKLLFQIKGFDTSDRSSIDFYSGETGKLFQSKDLIDVAFVSG
ncbi:MAG: DUF1963 domain-containing protein [Allomuricauda sp.]